MGVQILNKKIEIKINIFLSFYTYDLQKKQDVQLHTRHTRFHHAWLIAILYFSKLTTYTFEYWSVFNCSSIIGWFRIILNLYLLRKKITWIPKFAWLKYRCRNLYRYFCKCLFLGDILTLPSGAPDVQQPL